MAQWQQGKVVVNKHWNQRLCSLKIEVDLPVFEAGQFIRIGLPDSDDEQKMEARPYSFVNAPHEGLLEIYFNQVPEGSLSNRLAALHEADAVYVADRPAGFMTESEIPDGETLWLLASGTALGPFLSILKTLNPWQRFKHIVLVHGVRNAEELTYSELIGKLQKLHSDQLIKANCVTREEIVGALHERIPMAIANGHLERLVGFDFNVNKSRVMLCGNPAMVEGSLEALQEKGFRKHLRREPGQILQEIYK